MALTHSKEQKKPKLKAGSRVSVRNKVKREDIVNEKEEPQVLSVTFPANIRADNHIRNELSALLNLGIEKNMKALLNHLIETEKSSLGDSQITRLEKMVSILEEKDFMSKSLKNG